MRIASVIVVAVVVPVMLAGQTPRDAAVPAPSDIGQGVIAGTVVADDADGRPVRRAVVTLNGAGLNGDRKTVTDDTGHFAVSGLPAGRYTLSVSKAGWVTAYYGSKHPGRPVFGEAPIVLQAGQRLTTVALRLLHGSAVTGVITDAFGRPTINAQVRLLPMRVENGQRTVDPMGGQAMGMIGQGAYGYTDDRGIYRLYGVLPGDYLIVASNFEGARGEDIQQLTPDDLQAARRALQAGQNSSPTSAAASGGPGGSTGTTHPGPTVGYAPVYYPGTFEASNAAVVTVGANEERSGVDFALMLAHTARVQGVLVEPDGRPAPGGQIQLALPPAPSVLLSTGQSARVLPDGTFTFSGVPPGHYSIVARGPDTLAPPPTTNVVGQAVVGGVVLGRGTGGPLMLWATGTTAVDGQDVTGLILTLQHGATLTGRLAFNGTTLTPPADPTRVGIMLTRATDDANMSMGMGMGIVVAQVDASGGLKFTNVPPGSYRVEVSMNSGRLGSPAAVNALKGWSPRSAVVSVGGSTAGRDAMDLPFDVTLATPVPELVVTFTDRVAELSGKVTDAAGHPISAYRLVAFSTDRALWGTTGRRLKEPVPTDPDGTFRISDLAPGEYFLAAVTDMDASDLKDPSFLTELAAQAIRLALAEGEKKVQNIIVPRRVMLLPALTRAAAVQAEFASTWSPCS